MNNYERIKNMSIDEMAELLNNQECETCCAYADSINCNGDNDCFTGIKQWLESEVRE